MTKTLSTIAALCILMGLIVLYNGHALAQDQNGILIVPFTINDKIQQPLLKTMIGDMLFTRLNAGHCMTVKEYRHMHPQASETLDVEQAKKVAQNNGLTHILVGSVSIFGGQYSIDAHIWTIHDQKPYFSHSVMAVSEKAVIPEIHQLCLRLKEAICKKSSNPQAQKEKIGAFTYEIFPRLDVAIQCLSVADVNQDNRPELVASDNHSVYLFDLSTNPLNLLSHYDADNTHNIIWLDAADMDNDSRPEIYVTAVHRLGGHLVSFVLEWHQDQLNVILHDEPYYFRCYHRYDGTMQLIGQKQAMTHFFANKVCLLKYYGQKLFVDTVQAIPPDSHFASFHQGNFTGPEKDYVIVRPNNQIEILDHALRRKWLSETLYAESKKMIILPRQTAQKAPHQEESFKYLNQRIQVADVDSDNIDEIIVSEQNAVSGSRLFKRYRQFQSGMITCLKWNGLGMIPLWKTPKISGYISDYIWFDKTGKGTMCVAVAAISKKFVFKSATTQILLFEYIQ